MNPQRFRAPLGYLLVGGVVGWLLPLTSPFTVQQIQAFRGATLRQSSVEYKYISPLLACDVGSEDAFPEFAPLKNKLSNLITNKIDAGDIQDVT